MLILARHLAFVSPLAWGLSSDSLDPHVQVLEHWSVWILPVADQSSAAVAWISSRPFRAPSFQAPCVPLEFSFCRLVSAFCTVHTCTSTWILLIADQSSAAEAYIVGKPSEALFFQTPCASLVLSFYKLVSAFCTVHTCTSPYILAIAPIGDVFLVIFVLHLVITL